MKLNELLKTKRIEADLSQRDISDRLGYESSQFISNWERGVSRPPKHAIKILIENYKLDPKEFYETYSADMTQIAVTNVKNIFEGVV